MSEINEDILVAWRVNAQLKRFEMVPYKQLENVYCEPEVDPE